MTNESNPWKMIVIGCLVTLVVACCCCTGGLALLYQTSWAGPHGAAQGFFEDVRAHRYDRALQRMEPSYQQQHDVAAFTAAVQAIPELVTQTDATITSFQVVNTSATLSGTLTTPTGAAPLTMLLEMHGQAWHIVSVTVNGKTLP